ARSTARRESRTLDQAKSQRAIVGAPQRAETTELIEPRTNHYGSDQLNEYEIGAAHSGWSFSLDDLRAVVLCYDYQLCRSSGNRNALEVSPGCIPVELDRLWKHRRGLYCGVRAGLVDCGAPDRSLWYQDRICERAYGLESSGDGPCARSLGIWFWCRPGCAGFWRSRQFSGRDQNGSRVVSQKRESTGDGNFQRRF